MEFLGWVLWGNSLEYFGPALPELGTGPVQIPSGCPAVLSEKAGEGAEETSRARGEQGQGRLPEGGAIPAEH